MRVAISRFTENIMTFFSIRTVLVPASALLALALTGCLDSSDDHKHGGENAWEHACAHAGDTPTAVTAAADASTAPLVGAAHTLYGVSFTAQSKVRINFDEHAEFGIFLSKNVPVTLTTAAGDTIDFEESVTPLEGCAELAAMHVAHVDSGAHVLIFGASGETSVNLLVEELGGHAH